MADLPPVAHRKLDAHPPSPGVRLLAPSQGPRKCDVHSERDQGQREAHPDPDTQDQVKGGNAGRPQYPEWMGSGRENLLGGGLGAAAASVRPWDSGHPLTPGLAKPPILGAANRPEHAWGRWSLRPGSGDTVPGLHIPRAGHTGVADCRPMQGD